jgi:uncharacterized membrane-anchored protein
MARLEEAENAGHQTVRRWLVAAAEGEPDPAWICDKCGTPAPEWRAVCAHCREFDSLVWRVPLRTTGAITLMPPAPTPGAGESRALVPVVVTPARPDLAANTDLGPSNPHSPAGRGQGEANAPPAESSNHRSAEKANGEAPPPRVLPSPPSPRPVVEEGGPPVDAARLVN